MIESFSRRFDCDIQNVENTKRISVPCCRMSIGWLKCVTNLAIGQPNVVRPTHIVMTLHTRSSINVWKYARNTPGWIFFFFTGIKRIRQIKKKLPSRESRSISKNLFMSARRENRSSSALLAVFQRNVNGRYLTSCHAMYTSRIFWISWEFSRSRDWMDTDTFSQTRHSESLHFDFIDTARAK